MTARVGDQSTGYIGKIIDRVMTTSRVSGAQTLVSGRAYANTGAAATWTLPAAASSADSEVFVMNAGTGSITLASASGSEVFSTAARASIRVRTGMHVRLICDGTYWYPIFPTRTLEVAVTDPNAASAITAGDGQGWLTVPSDLDGWHVASVHVAVTTAPQAAGGVPLFQLANVTQGWDVLTSGAGRVSIDETEFTSYTAATQPTVDTSSSHDVLTQGDRLRFDFDAVGTGVKGVSYIIRASL